MVALWEPLEGWNPSWLVLQVTLISILVQLCRDIPFGSVADRSPTKVATVLVQT